MYTASRARTTTGPPPHSAGINRRQVFPTVWAGTNGVVPTFTLEPFNGVGPQLCPCNLATVMPQSFTVASRPATSTSPGVPDWTGPSGARCNPALICQVGAGGSCLRGFLPLVPRVHLSVSLAGPTPSDSAGASRRCQGCFHPSPMSLGSGCPQLRSACCDRLMAVASHHRKVQERLVALDVRCPLAVLGIGGEVALQHIGCHRVVMVRVGSHPVAASALGAKVLLAHQTRYAVPSDCHAVLDQVPVHPRAAVGPTVTCGRAESASRIQAADLPSFSMTKSSV